MVIEADMSKCKDPENRSRKLCVCGGHNHNNPKRNLNHNATAAKRSIQIQREFTERLLKNSKELEPEFSATVDKHFWELI